LRATLFSLLGHAGDKGVIADSRKIAEEYLSKPASVDPNLANAALAVAAANGDAALFDKLQQAYETADNPQLQEEALHLLATFKNPHWNVVHSTLQRRERSRTRTPSSCSRLAWFCRLLVR
jgi:aminopeptidase N/puromycin-sensitive aminopeptidase